jgi:hypothetical protein
MAVFDNPACPYPDQADAEQADFHRIIHLKIYDMKKIHASAFLFVAAIMAWSCGPSLKVSSDYDKNVDFGKYKTFALYNAENIHDAISELNQARIYAAIRNEMAKKGYVESTGSPELLVNTTAILQDRSSVSSTTTGGAYMYGSVYRPYSWGPGVSYTNYDVRHYKDGSLIIDIIDAQSKKLLWQGTGNKEIDAPIKDPDTNIPKAIAAIMDEFPPGKKK